MSLGRILSFAIQWLHSERGISIGELKAIRHQQNPPFTEIGNTSYEHPARRIESQMQDSAKTSG